MGYTRYYEVVESNAFKKEFLDKVKKVIEIAKENHGVVIRGWDGNGEPEITETKISLNGDEETGNAHETFTIDITRDGFDFCKTREKPYDMVVYAIIKIAYEYGYLRKMSSDGKSEYEDIGEKIFKIAMGVK